VWCYREEMTPHLIILYYQENIFLSSYKKTVMQHLSNFIDVKLVDQHGRIEKGCLPLRLKSPYSRCSNKYIVSKGQTEFIIKVDRSGRALLLPISMRQPLGFECLPIKMNWLWTIALQRILIWDAVYSHDDLFGCWTSIENQKMSFSCWKRKC